MLSWKGWKVLDCALINLGATFSRIPCMTRLEVAKRGTCTRFSRQEWIRDHYNWKAVVLRYCDAQMWRCLLGLSWSSLSSVPHPACLPNCWSCCPKVAPGQLPDAWLRTHTGDSDTETFTSHRSLHGLLCGSNLAGGMLAFLDSPASSKLSTHTS